MPLQIDTSARPDRTSTLVAFGRRWVVCLMVAAGVALLSVSTVQLALFVLDSIAVLFGLPIVDGITRRVV